MASDNAVPLPRSPARWTLPASAVRNLRLSEWVLIAYFCYTMALAAFWNRSTSIQPAIPLSAAAIPVAVLLLAWADSRRPRKLTGILRDWLPLALVLCAYLRLDAFRPALHSYRLERGWVLWDRRLLNDWGGRAVIEALGLLLPSLLDLSYLLLYAIPPLCVAMLYWSGRRRQVDRFLFMFLSGTLLAYSILPFFPSDPPRLVFPGEDLPGVNTVLRRIVLWLLDRYDIRTSVFPSGHIAAAFSAAFAMLVVLPENRRVGWMLVAAAWWIGVAAVYGRYHYAVDVLAGFAVSLAAAALTASLRLPRLRQQPGASPAQF